MLGLSIDYSDVRRVMGNLKIAEDQIPFAMALALNDATKVTRAFLVRHTWPGHIKQRNASFISAALTTKFATKTNLSTEIYEHPRMQGRGHLMLQAKGGTRVGKGGSIAVPVSNVPRGARGVPQRLRPKNLQNAVRIKDALYTRNARGKLQLMYVLKKATRIPRRVPFYEDHAASMRRELRRSIPLAVQKAMATARR